MAEIDLSLHRHGRSPAQNDVALTHARNLILRVCYIAGTAAFIDEAGLGPEEKELRKAIHTRNTPALFSRLVAALSYQGISDEVAKSFMDRHGLASWHVIETDLRKRPSCPKLQATGTFTTAGTTRAGSPVPSPTTSRTAHCRDPGCATAASTRPPTRCICSFAMSLTATWLVGSTGAWTSPAGILSPAGWRECAPT
jgi:hypothetical protein